MKILVISYMFPCKRHPISGIFFANLLRELANKVDELVVITPRPYIPKFLTKIKKSWSKWYLDSMNSEINRIKIIRPYVLTLRGISFLGINGILWQYSLSNLVKQLKNNIDIIIGHNVLPDGIAAARLAKMINVPCFLWCIGSDINDFAQYNFFNNYLTRKCLEESQYVLTTSKDLENKIKIFNNKPIQVRTFYRGIDISNFQNIPPRVSLLKGLQLNPDKIYILFIGRLIYDKGIYELAEAFNIIAKRYPDIDLILIGEEIEKEKLIAKFRDYGILNRVIFKGIIQYSEVAKYMKVSNLLVLPTWAEGLPNVVMEAMAVGLPVVATDVGGIPEVLENEVTGLSVPAKNVEKLIEAIIRMIEDRDLRENCIKNAKNLIYEKFDVKKNVHQLYDLLQEVKNNYSQSHPK
ncbi:MAG: glycosyltransferase [Nitrospirae bacterium]|nr:glycosyltransferase [Nitrospirota bacterium]